MSFSWFDIVAVVILAVNVLRGWREGGVTMVGNLASMVVGFVVTAYVMEWVNAYWLSGSPIVSIVVFGILFLLVLRLLHLAVGLLDRLFRIVSIIPLVGPMNRVIGAAVGAVEGVIIVLLVVYAVALFLTAFVQPTGFAYEYGLLFMRNASLVFPAIPL